jgi:hypothetical protein
LQSEVENVIKEMRNKKAAGDDVPGEMCSNYWEKAV